MHTDEAINAYIVGQLLSGEAYSYDPQDRHGPALAALALPLVRIEGARSFSDLTELQVRLASVVAGTATILLFGFAAEIFGFVPSLLAALLFAVAPLPVYYDRYFIHESLFCALTFAFILSGWRACTTRSIGYAVLAGACAALMVASKETAILHFVALAVAAALYRGLTPRSEASVGTLRPVQLLSACAAFVLTLVAFFTWFGTNAKGLAALAHVLPAVFARAGGQGHAKPFWYFGKLLAAGWSGGVIVAFACIGDLPRAAQARCIALSLARLV